jgi:hypothetical protein
MSDTIDSVNATVKNVEAGASSVLTAAEQGVTGAVASVKADATNAFNTVYDDVEQDVQQAKSWLTGENLIWLALIGVGVVGLIAYVIFGH